MPPPPILLPVFTLGFHHEPAIEPTEWIPASVPGAVQLDWARAHDWPEWWRGDEWKRYRWMEDVWWTYRTSFAPPSLHPGERLRLVLCGIDHSAEVRLNGTGLARHTGMQTPLVVDLTPHLQPHNELRVTIQPAPKSRATPENRRQANATTKAAVSYTWDFHPRLIPLGLSRAATMEVIRTDGLESAELVCEVAANQNLAGPTFALELPAAPQGLFELELTVEGRPGLGSTYTLCFAPPDPAMLDVRGPASGPFGQRSARLQPALPLSSRSTTANNNPRTDLTGSAIRLAQSLPY